MFIITDVNEHLPQFDQESYNISIDEGVSEEYILFFFEDVVSDLDGGNVFGTVTGFEMLPTNDPEFPVNLSEDGELVTNEFAADIDYDTGDREISLSDSGT